MKNRFQGISANVLFLGAVSFLNDLSSEMIIPILPMFIAALGGGGVAIGLIGGLRDSIVSILKIFSGFWADKTGRRKIFVFSGYLTSSVFKLFLPFSRIWQHVLIFAGMERIGKGLRTAPRDAIIADSMPGESGKGFGIHRAFDTSGALLGSGLVFLLFWFLGLGFKPIIFVAAVIAFLSLLPLHFVREEKKTPKTLTLKIGIRSFTKPLRLFLVISGIFALSNFSYMFFILRAQELFEGRLSIGAPILLYILFNIFYAGFALPFGALSDKIGKRKVIVFGYLLFSLTCLGFAVFKSTGVYIFLFAAYGVVQAIIDGNQRAYVSDLASKELRATVLGTFHTVIGVSTLPASLIAGFLWQINPGMTFIYGSVVSALSVVLLIVFRNKEGFS